MLQKIKDFVAKSVYKIIPPPRIPSTILNRNSFSQAGEDALLNFLLMDYGMAKFEYLEIGTNNPISGNNTYAFYKKGFRGVCVEADAELISAIKEARPKDKVINVGIAEKSGSADFFVFEASGINTFDKDEAEKRSASGEYQLKKVVKVPLITINELIDKNFETYPDFLSIDIEGLDLMVLKSLDYSKYPIPIICVETCMYSENHIRPKDHSIREYMETQDYEVYADTYINTIFVNKKWFYNK